MLPDNIRKLRCVLQHYYELRAQGEEMGTANTKRFVDIKSLAMVASRQGLDAVKATVLNAGRSLVVAAPAYLPVGAGLFSNDVRVETIVRKALAHTSQDYRIGAIYAAVFYVKLSDEMTSVLAELSMLGTGLEQLAAADALRAAQQLPCRDCARTSGIADQESIGWAPFRRVSSTRA